MQKDHSKGFQKTQIKAGIIDASKPNFEFQKTLKTYQNVIRNHKSIQTKAGILQHYAYIEIETRILVKHE